MAAVPDGATVAVTGASGFIGSHVVEAVLRAGFAVRAVVRDPSNAAKTAHLEAIAKDYDAALTFARGDLGVDGSFDAAFAGADAVVHVAAVVEVTGSSDAAAAIIAPSVDGCRNVLASVRRSGTVKKFVHTSSCIAVAAVDTKGGGDKFYDEGDFNEWSTAASDPYGYAKTAAEALVRETCAELDIPLATLNPGVTLGPCFTKQHTKASTVLLRELLYGNPLLNYNCTFVDVRDVADAHARALRTDVTGRFLCVNDDGVRNTLDLGAYARAACPQWRTDATPMYSPNFLAAARALYNVPYVGPAACGLAGVTDFKLRACEDRIPFANGRAKETLGVAFRPLTDTVRDGLASIVDGGWVTPRAPETLPPPGKPSTRPQRPPRFLGGSECSLLNGARSNQKAANQMRRAPGKKPLLHTGAP